VTEPSIYTVSMMFLTHTESEKHWKKKQKKTKQNKKKNRKKTKIQM